MTARLRFHRVLTVPLLPLVAAAAFDPAAAQTDERMLEGNWYVEWHDSPEPDGITRAALTLARPWTTRCEPAGPPEPCRWAPVRVDTLPWSLGGYRGNDFGRSYYSASSLAVGDGRVEIQHPSFVLGWWGGRSVLEQVDRDELRGRWSYGDQGGTVTWRRARAAVSRVRFRSGIDTTVAAGEVGRIEMGYGYTWEAWVGARGNRPTFRIDVYGEHLWGLHTLEFRDEVGLEPYGYSRISDDSDGVVRPGGIVGLSIEFFIWPGATPGRKVLYVDSIAIPFDLVVHGFPEPPPVVTDLGFTATDPDVPLTEAIPLQFVHLTARTDRSPSADTLGRVQATVLNAMTGQSVQVPLIERSPTAARYSSPRVLLAVEGAERNQGETELAVCPGDVLLARLDGRTDTLVVAAPDDAFDPDPCAPTPAPPVLRLEPVGATAIRLDPQSGAAATPLRVRFRGPGGEAIAHEPIVWRLADEEVGFITYTDERGEARLDFATRGRGFQVVVDGVPVGDPLARDGVYGIDAFPKNPLFGSLLASGPPSFRVDFVRPTVVEILNAQHGRTPVLMDEQPFHVRVWLGRADAAAHGSAAELDLVVAGSGGDRIEVEAARGASGVYETGARIWAVDSGDPLRSPEVEAPNAGTITASFGRTSASVRFYTSNLNRMEAEADALLVFYERAINGALAGASGLSPAARELLDTKAALAANARRWQREPHPTRRHAVMTTQAYLKLLADDVEALGEPIDRPAAAYTLPTSLQGTAIRFRTTAEAASVVAALQGSTASVIADVLAVPGEIRESFTEWVSSLPENLVAGPALGAYTAITGWTSDGNVASTLERVLGGVEAVAALAGGAGAAGRLAGLGRSARAIGLRAAVAEAAAAEVGFASVLVRSADDALAPIATRAAVAEAAEAAEAAAAPSRGARTAARLQRSSERSGEFMRRWGAELDGSSAKLDRLRRELDELRQRKARAVAAGRGTRTVTRDILSKERNIARTEARVERLRAKVERHRRIKERADLALARRARADLSAEMLAALKRDGRLPRPRDRIGGTLAQDHYEAQINRRLAASGYRAGTGVRLRTSYPSPLGEGYGAAPRVGRVRRRTKSPVMDHIDESTLDVADSKYYSFERAAGSPEAARKAAREIADTAEKGRLVQAERIRARRRDNGLPDDEDAVWAEVWSRKVTIVTPVDVPPNVAGMIRTLVGPRSAANLVFETVPADVDAWARPAQ